MNRWRDHITTNADVCDGEPCIRGTRVLVSVVLDNLAEGLTPDEIVREYPPLTIQDLQAGIAYAEHRRRI